MLPDPSFCHNVGAMIRITPLAAVALATGAMAFAQPPSSLTLEQALARALAQSPHRQGAVALVEGAKTAARFAAVWPNPSLDLRAENWSFGSWPWNPSPDPSAPPPLDAFVVVSQTVELGGKRSARRSIGEAELRAAESTLGQVERAVLLDTTRIFLDIVRNREALKELVQNRDELGGLQKAMGARVREGMAAASDLAKFQAETARLETQTLRTRIELNRGVGLLGALLRMDTPLSADQLVEPAPVSPPAGDLAALVARGVERSPDVRAALAKESHAAHALALEKARRVPDTILSGGYKRTAGFDGGVLGVALPLPLFDRNQRGIAVATGQTRATAQERLGAEARAAAEIRTSLEAARLLDERARRVDEELLRPAEVVRVAARSAFREGAADILTLVDAERVYLDARREALLVRLDALAAAIEARVLLGEEIVR
jgi:outer membrane protein, heavy metal efflux system